MLQCLTYCLCSTSYCPICYNAKKHAAFVPHPPAPYPTLLNMLHSLESCCPIPYTTQHTAHVPHPAAHIIHYSTYSQIQIWPSCCFYIPSAARPRCARNIKAARVSDLNLTTQHTACVPHPAAPYHTMLNILPLLPILLPHILQC